MSSREFDDTSNWETDDGHFPWAMIPLIIITLIFSAIMIYLRYKFCHYLWRRNTTIIVVNNARDGSTERLARNYPEPAMDTPPPYIPAIVPASDCSRNTNVMQK